MLAVKNIDSLKRMTSVERKLDQITQQDVSPSILRADPTTTAMQGYKDCVVPRNRWLRRNDLFNLV
jgi:hypothetical protein